ncbi:hypothetical protein GS682_33145, partial [Nostoc sp. B(2019)]|nr:hypothetical protein [Nostoc sp. B(2019)]
ESEYTRVRRSLISCLNLLTLLGQIVEGLQMLQANGVLAIPHFHRTTKVIYCADNCPTPTLTSEFWVALTPKFVVIVCLLVISAVLSNGSLMNTTATFPLVPSYFTRVYCNTQQR